MRRSVCLRCFRERYVNIAIDGGRITVANDAFIGFSGSIRIYEPNSSGQYVEVADVSPKSLGFGSDAGISDDLGWALRSATSDDNVAYVFEFTELGR